MEDRPDSQEGELVADAFELADSDSENLETAMRDALEAVEKRGTGPAADGADGDAEGGDVEVRTLRAELEALRDRSLRTLADFDNYRKRVQRERRDQSRYAGFEIFREILPIVDNLERALRSEGDAEDLKVGIEMVVRQLQDALGRFGVERVSAADQPFDPRLHEAVSREEQTDLDGPIVMEELQPGYTMHDRLIRPAQVKVAVPADPDEESPKGEAN